METDQRVLVTLDGSKCAEAVIPKAQELASSLGTGICLLRVASAHTFPGVDPTEAEVKAVRKAEKYLEGWESVLKGRGFDVDAHVRYGNDAEEILEHSGQKEIGFIAMSTHGHRGLKRLLLGSVAEKVLRRAPKPVFLARCNG